MVLLVSLVSLDVVLISKLEECEVFGEIEAGEVEFGEVDEVEARSFCISPGLDGSDFLTIPVIETLQMKKEKNMVTCLKIGKMLLIHSNDVD